MSVTPLSPVQPSPAVTASVVSDGLAGKVPERLLTVARADVALEASQQNTQQNQETDELDLAESIKQMNSVTQAFGMQVRFAIHDESGQVIVQVYDMTSQKVIREIPPQHLKEVLAKILDVGDVKGILLDNQA
jgi:flagellar protein FlaG